MKLNFINLLSIMSAVLIAASCCGTSPIINVDVPHRPEGQQDALLMTAPPIDTVKVGFIGLGMRGEDAIRRYAQIPGAKVQALCDLESEIVENSQNTLERYGKERAESFVGEDAWKKLCESPEIDLVYIATDWKHHAEMAVFAMEHGKHVAIEVPAAMTLDEIWELVNTSERTRKHCMQLENCVYDFFELNTLNMAQHGLFGEIIHVEGSYIHNLSDFWGEYWDNWRLRYNREYRGDVYPTHGFGPACQLLDIHRGDRLKTLVSMDTKAITGPKLWKESVGEDIDDFQNGDHTCTLISTEKGKTILIEHNVMTPRVYTRMYQLTGTEGFANKYPVKQYLFKNSPLTEESSSYDALDIHRPISKEMMEKLMDEYKHPIIADIEEKAREVGGHGGMDYIMDYRLVYCLRNGLPLDMDVYDLAEWCCLPELTRLSIENGNSPVAIPDFTRGSWNRIQGYRHAFIE